MPGDPELLAERRGAAGLLTLNRPEALNALTLGMVRAIATALDAWEHDAGVTRVVVNGAGARAFCAGGDIRHLYDLARAGRAEEALGFWRMEYRLNHRIATYPKPYISLIDGIVMGGGVGVSLHGRIRVAGDRYLFAFPECGIGFVPDVGATHALPRLPGGAGMRLALTGARVRAPEALALGLATHAVPSARLADLHEALIRGAPVEDAIRAVAHDPGPAETAGREAEIAEDYAAGGVAAILAALDARAGRGSESAGADARLIRRGSPTSLRLAHEAMRRGADLSLAEALRLEFRLVARLIEGHDFPEGVRAAIVDKDGAPRWRPATLDAVTDAEVAAHFAPISGGGGDLDVGA